MKRLPALILALTFSLSLVGCGGNEIATDAADSEVTLVSRKANSITLLVSSDFSEFQEVDGYAAAQAKGASIVITPTIERDVAIENITEDYMIDLVDDGYSNINVLKFDNAATIAGVDAVYFLFTGDGNTSDNNNTVCYITLFFSIDGQACAQEIAFTYNTGANTSLETNLSDIINSISLD